MRRTSVIVSLLLLATATTAFAQTSAKASRKPATLRYRFNKDEIDRYSYAVSIKITRSEASVGDGTPSSPTSMTVSMLMRERVLDVLPDHSAKIRLWVGGFKTSGPDAPKVDENMVKGIIANATKTEDGRILKIEGVENPPGTKAEIPFDINQVGQLLSFQQGALPQKPVAAGDSWTQLVDLPLSVGKLESTSTLAQDGVATAAGPAAKIHQVFKGRLDFSKMEGAGGKPRGPDDKGTGGPPQNGLGAPADNGTDGPADTGADGPPDSGVGNPPNNGAGGPPDNGTRHPADGGREAGKSGPGMNGGANVSGSADLLFSNRLGKLIASNTKIVLDMFGPKPAESASAENPSDGKDHITKIELTAKVTKLQ